MNVPIFAALTRRASLTTLNAPEVASVGKASIAAAKKKKKRKKGKDNGGCARQAQVYEQFLGIQCDVNPQPTCEDAIACGEFLETCNFTGFFNCFQAATAP